MFAASSQGAYAAGLESHKSTMLMWEAGVKSLGDSGHVKVTDQVQNLENYK